MLTICDYVKCVILSIQVWNLILQLKGNTSYQCYLFNWVNWTSFVVSIFKFQYYKELCTHDPSIKPQTMVDFQSFDTMLNTLDNKVINVSLLKRMSEAFKWNYQKVLVTQVIYFFMFLSRLYIYDSYYKVKPVSMMLIVTLKVVIIIKIISFLVLSSCRWGRYVPPNKITYYNRISSQSFLKLWVIGNLSQHFCGQNEITHLCSCFGGAYFATFIAYNALLLPYI